MSTPVTYNGVIYFVPAFGDTGYAQGPGNLSLYLIALATGSLTTSTGSFPLLGDVNFGVNFGLIAKYFTSVTANPASAGSIRLANTDTIDWRNFANSGNDVLAVNASDQLTYNGAVINTSIASGIVSPGTQYQLAYYALTGSTVSGNPNVMASTQSVVTDVNGVPTTTGNGGTTAAEIGFVHGVTSAIQTQINTKGAAAGTAGQIAVFNGANSIVSGVTGSMNGTKITSLAAATAAGDAVRYEQWHIAANVVYVSTSTLYAISTTNFTTTPLTALAASITPALATSLVLIRLCIEIDLYPTTGHAQYMNIRLLRGGSTVKQWSECASFGGGTLTGEIQGSTLCLEYLDSPTAISSQSYTVQAALDAVATSGTGAINGGVGGSPSSSSITLQEIPA